MSGEGPSATEGVVSTPVEVVLRGLEGWLGGMRPSLGGAVTRRILIEAFLEAFERGVSVELRFCGALIGGRQLSQVVQGVVEGGLGFGVIVLTGKQGASSCQLSIVHSRGAFDSRRVFRAGA